MVLIALIPAQASIRGRLKVNAQSQSYPMTDGQPACLSCYQATIQDPQPIFLSYPWNFSSDSCGFAFL
jgi:hypothetical protein